MVGRISSTKGGTHHIAILVALACSILLGLAACSDEPDPTADAVPGPTAAISPPISLTASATARSVVEVETPQPTPLAPPGPPLATPATTLTWEGDGLNDLEQKASQSLGAIEIAAPKAAEAIRELSWVGDELTLDEGLTLALLEEMAVEDETLVQSLLDLPWLADEIADDELSSAMNIGDIAKRDVSLGKDVAGAPWVVDGVNPDERATLSLIEGVVDRDAEVARIMLEYPDIPAAAFRGGTYPFEFLRSMYVDGFYEEFPDLALTIFSYPGLDDGNFKTLILTASSLLKIARQDEEMARIVLEWPWVADGLTSKERDTINVIAGISTSDPVLVRQLVNYSWIADGVDAKEQRSLGLAWRVTVYNPTLARILLGQNWFQDGVSDEEAALLVSLGTAVSWTSFAEDLIKSGQVRSKLISLPAGDVKVYAVSRSSLDQDAEHIFRAVREGIEAIEDFMGPPWVRPEIIVYLEPELEYIIEVAGLNAGSHIAIRGVSEREWQNYVIYHELAHFYFGYRNSPKWLAEGGANFLEAYTLHFGSGVAMEELYQYTRRGVAWSCLPKGITKVNDWNEATAGLSGSEYHLSPLWSCTYPIGEAFLLGMYKSLGHATVEAALRALYRRGERSFHSASEDDVYTIFLRNTPTEDQNMFEDTYFCLHGREMPDFARRPACEVYTPIPTPVYWAELEIFTPITPAPIPTPGATPTPSPASTPMLAPSVTPDALDGGVAADRNALTAFYHATGGPNWINNDNWLTNAPFGQWYGVTTDNSGRVTVLDLHENGLTGQLPPELGDLANLVHLVVWTNKLTGGLPQELTKLGNLINLSVGNNLLAGEIPAWLSRMTNLEWLHLTSNRFSGTIPGELTSLNNLKLLYIYGYQLSGCIPAGLRRVEDNDFLYMEQSLRMTFCDAPPLPTLTPTPTPVPPTGDPAKDRATLIAFYTATGGPNWRNNDNWLTNAPLGQWYGVTTTSNGVVIGLDLDWNGLVGSIPPELVDLRNLEVLALVDNQLSGELPAELGSLSSLRFLELSGNQLVGPIPSELGSLSALKGLGLGQNSLSGGIPAELGLLSQLTYLNLRFNQLNGEIPSQLGNLRNLTGLLLIGNDFTGCLPAHWESIEHNDFHNMTLPFCDQ